MVLPADLGDPAQLAALKPALLPSDQLDPAVWAAAIGVNVTAAATLSFTLLPGMRPGAGGES